LSLDWSFLYGNPDIMTYFWTIRCYSRKSYYNSIWSYV